MSEDELLTPAEVAVLLKVSVDQVHILVNKAKLRGTRLGPRTLRIYESSVNKLIEEGKTDANV